MPKGVPKRKPKYAPSRWLKPEEIQPHSTSACRKHARGKEYNEPTPKFGSDEQV